MLSGRVSRPASVRIDSRKALLTLVVAALPRLPQHRQLDLAFATASRQSAATAGSAGCPFSALPNSSTGG